MRCVFLSPVLGNLYEYGSNSKFPSTGPGFLVRVQVPEYKSRFPSTDFEKIIEITSFLQISLKMFYLSFLD